MAFSLNLCSNCAATGLERSRKTKALEAPKSTYIDDAYIKYYRYAPTKDLRTVAEDLYTEVGSIAMTLIGVKVACVRDTL